ncbi:MAG: DUF885 family protein, partial [Polyangiaceae bacterium]
MRSLFVLFALASCGRKTPPAPPEPAPRPAPVSVPVSPAALGIQDPLLADILIEHWDALMQRYPTWASDVGDHRFDDRVTDVSLSSEEQFRGRSSDWKQRLEALEGLSPSDALNRDLLVHSLRTSLAESVCQHSLWSFSPRSNPLLDGNRLAEANDLATADDVRNLVRRIDGLTEQLPVHIENTRMGLGKGLVANRASTELVIQQTRAALATPLAESPMVTAFSGRKGTLEPAEQAELQGEVERATKAWRAGITAWVAFLEAEVLPKARTEAVGLTGIPGGAECYAALV